MLTNFGYYKTLISLFWVQTTLSMKLLNHNPFVMGSNADNGIAEMIFAQGYLPNENDMPKMSVIKNVDNDATYLLSKLSDEDLIKLLNEQPNKNEYNLQDIVKIAVDSKPTTNYKSIVDFDQPKSVPVVNNFFDKNIDFDKRLQVVEKNNAQNAVFRLENKQVDPFVTSRGLDPQYVAVQKIQNLLYGRPTEVDAEHKNDDDDEKKELIFDVLVAQLKTLCCKQNKSTKKKDNLRHKLKSVLNHFVPLNTIKKAVLPDRQPASIPSTISNEYMFLILNDEIRSNESDGLISVDPDSLGKNSSVLLLGPIVTPLSDVQLKLAMTRISNELSKQEYLPLLQQLSDGTISNENVRVVNSLVTGPETRRYIKPHRCNHQSKLAKVYGGPKWIICTGYLNINTPSLYDK